MRNILPFPTLGRGSALALVLALSACALDNPLRDTRYSACHVLGSSDWKAQVELYESKGVLPYLKRRLVVTGKVTTAGGYLASLGQGPVARLDEPVQHVTVRTEGSPQAGAAPVVHEVRGVFPAMKRYGGIAIRCGDGVIAEIREVPVPPRQKREDPYAF